jgi:hypothetical protein
MKVPRTHSREMSVSLMNDFGTTIYLHAENMRPPYLVPDIKINSKLINVRSKTIKLQEEIIEYVFYINLCNDFLNNNSKQKQN